jgi:hypothetical protein
LIVASLAVGWTMGTRNHQVPSSNDVVNHHTGPTIEQIQALSQLVTTRVDVADVLETRLDGYTGGAQVAMLIKGDFLLGVDLSQAKFDSLNTEARTVVLVLPQPQVTSPRLDHERTMVFRVLQTGLWQIAPGGGQTSGDVIDRGYRDAQRFVADACNDPAIIARSREQAQSVISAFSKAIGWEVTLRWNE